MGRKKKFEDGDFVMICIKDYDECPARIYFRDTRRQSYASIVEDGRLRTYYIYNTSYVRHMTIPEITAAKLAGLR